MLLKVLLLCNVSLIFELSLQFLDIIFYFSALLLISVLCQFLIPTSLMLANLQMFYFLWCYCMSSFLLVHCGPFLPTCSYGRDASTIASVIHVLREAAPHASCFSWLSLLVTVSQGCGSYMRARKQRLTNIYEVHSLSQFCTEINKYLLS